MLAVDLPPRHDAIVDDALAELATEDWDAAADRLRTAYESVCERDHPGLGDGPHPVACHLYGDASERRADFDARD